MRAVVSNFRDVTERKLVEEEGRKRQEALTDFIENATVGLHWVGPDGTILWANQAELEMLGYWKRRGPSTAARPPDRSTRRPRQGGCGCDVSDRVGTFTGPVPRRPEVTEIESPVQQPSR